jgi:hypothetical protein
MGWNNNEMLLKINMQTESWLFHKLIKTSRNDYTVFYYFKSLKIGESMAI